MQVGSYNRDNTPKFKGHPIIDAVGAIESNILLNKGITDLGGIAVPQVIVSNNKDESIERIFKAVAYFAITFVSPFLLLPLFNKAALSHVGKIKNLKGDSKKILEVSKKYLTKDDKYLEKGIREKSKELFGHEKGFDDILNKYEDKEKLRKDLIKTHAAVLGVDFLTTNLMVASNPWLANLLTKHRTNRSGYSGTYNMADEDFTKIDANKHDKTKKLRQGTTLFFSVLPALVIPPLLKKGMLSGGKSTNKLINMFNKHAEKFDYQNSKYMSRLTAFIMWATSMFLPLQLACRDKYEQKDAIVRGTSIGLIFWGGDILLRKTFAKVSDKFFGTNLINKETKKPYYLKKLKNYKNIDSLKNLPKDVIRRSQKASAGLYALNLTLIMGALGFGVPAILNKVIKKKVNEDNTKNNENNKSVNTINYPANKNFNSLNKFRAEIHEK